jgi:hypothetical protein
VILIFGVLQAVNLFLIALFYAVMTSTGVSG